LNLWNVLFDILILLSTALVLGVICEKLRQSPILGYLAAGTLLGPNAFELISSSSEVSAVAELGVALLLFTIGLEFSWARLRLLGPAALWGGSAQVVFTLGVGAGGAALFGVSMRTALAIGAVLALSSTACVLRLLVARSELESHHGRHALGILLMQDIAVVPLVLLVTILGGKGSLGEVGIDIFRSLSLAFVLVGVLYVVLKWVVPKALAFESMKKNRDLPILLAIVTGLGSAWGSHKLGLSPALGAFVAGMILAESPFAIQIRADIGSIRTLLVTLFFSSIGMLGDPAWFANHLPAVLSLVAAIVIGKALIIWITLRAFRLTHTNALAAGICLAQVGEFSFVLAAVGRGTVIDDELFSLIISATITTLFLTPYLVAMAPSVAAMIVKLISRWRIIKPEPMSTAEKPTTPGDHLIIIGFGPAGQAVGESLKDIDKQVMVIDLNPNTIAESNRIGLDGTIGDATQGDVLEHAGVESAAAVIVAIPDPSAAIATVKLIRTLSPEVYILVRARYHRYFSGLEAVGANEVIDEEQLVGTRLAERLRDHLGEPEQ